MAAKDELAVLLPKVQDQSQGWSAERRGPRLEAALQGAASANASGVGIDAALGELQAAWLEATDPKGPLSAVRV